jgi:hypothetical protein
VALPDEQEMTETLHDWPERTGVGPGRRTAAPCRQSDLSEAVPQR